MRSRSFKTFLLIAIAISVLFASGCWDAQELNTLSIVAGIGIDTASVADEFCVCVQIGKARAGQEIKSTSEKGDGASILLEAPAKSVQLALDQLSLRDARELFLNHNQIIVIGSAQARKGITPVLDLFLRKTETRLETWVAVSEKTAKELFMVNLMQEPITAIGIANIMKKWNVHSHCLATNMLDLTSSILDKGIAPTIPIVDTIEDTGKIKLAITGMALFDKDKMVGRINTEEALGYALAMGELNNVDIAVSLDDGMATLHIDTATSQFAPDLSQTIKIKLDVSAQLSIAELKGFDGVSMKDLLPRLKEEAQKELKNMIEKTFVKAQQFKTDIYGFGLSIHRKYPKEWKEALSDNWPDIFSNIILDTNVKAQIIHTGNISDALSMRGEQ